MRKLIMKMSASLDGFVGGPHGENDWIFKSSDEESRAWSVGAVKEAGLLVVGRKSFELWTNYWPTAPGPFAAPMNALPKVVFTQQKGYKVSPSAAPSPATASWDEAQVSDGDLAEGIRQLKEGSGKPILALGGAGFMRSLIATGLIDEFQLAIHPVVLGSGLPIFNGLAKPSDLKLVEAKAFPGGIVVHIYRPA